MSLEPIRTDSDATERLCSALGGTAGDTAMIADIFRGGFLGMRALIRANRRANGIAGMASGPIGTDSDATERLCSALRITRGEAAIIADICRGGCLGASARTLRIKRLAAVPVGIGNTPRPLGPSDDPETAVGPYPIPPRSSSPSEDLDAAVGPCRNAPRPLGPSDDPETAVGPYPIPPRSSSPSDDPVAAVGPCRNTPRSRGPSAIIWFLEGLWSMPEQGHAARRRERGAGIRRNRRMKRKQYMQWS